MPLPRPRSLDRVRQTTPEGQALQDSVEELARQVPRFFWTQMAVVEVTLAAATPQDVPHKLDGAYVGHVVIALDAATATAPTVYATRADLPASLAATHIRLESPADCTAKVMVWR